MVLHPDDGQTGLARTPHRKRHVGDHAVAIPCVGDHAHLDIHDEQGGLGTGASGHDLANSVAMQPRADSALAA